MARALSSEKRQLIIETAKRLFGQNGFGTTSVADVAKAAELPVGSIYTYFQGKEDLIRSIVDEGWSDLRMRLEKSFATTTSPEQRFRLLLDKFLPELLADVDFISILLTEGVVFTRIEEKATELVGIIGSTIEPLDLEKTSLRKFSATDMEVALMVYFLGMLAAVRMCRETNLAITASDVLAFLRLTIQNGLGVEV